MFKVMGSESSARVKWLSKGLRMGISQRGNKSGHPSLLAMRDKGALIFSSFIYPARYKSDRFAFDRTRHTMTATTSSPEFGGGDGDDLDASLA